MVADDERPVRELLIEIVEEAGHTALSARDGNEALALAQRYHPHLIISDVKMPELDGYGLAQAIRADPTLAHTMVLLISANFNHYALPTVPGARVMAKPLDLTTIEQMLLRCRSASCVVRALCPIYVLDDHIKVKRAIHSFAATTPVL